MYSFKTVRAVTCLFLTNAWRAKGLNAVSYIAVCVGSRVQKKWQQSNVKKRLCVGSSSFVYMKQENVHSSACNGDVMRQICKVALCLIKQHSIKIHE